MTHLCNIPFSLDLKDIYATDKRYVVKRILYQTLTHFYE